jgi:acetyl esterase/lipase
MALYAAALDGFVEETKNLNQLVASYAAAVPDDVWASPEGLEQLRHPPSGSMLGTPLDDTEQLTIPGPAGDIPARVRRPTGAPRGVYLDIHGGGWCIGDAASDDVANAALAEATGVVTVSIDYRLAPEDPFPAAPDDCEAAALWLIKEGPGLFGTDKLVIGGGSAGAHLSALTLLRLRDNHDAADRVAGANLVFGLYDMGMTPSQRSAVDALLIPTDVIEHCVAYAAPGLDREGRRDPSISPLYADLTGLPPALFTVGMLDPVFDDNLFMSARWQAAGNPAELAVYPESIHGFVAFPTQMAAAANAKTHAFVNQVLS